MSTKGTSIIDLLVSLGILALLFGGIYLVYFSIVDGVANVELRTSAASILNQEVEIARNLPYDKVGTVGGIPAGVMPQSQTIRVGNQDFILSATIRNMDDPFDGLADGVPADTAPADYKLAAFEVSCVNCPHFVPLNFTTTIAPKNLESASSTGSLFVNVFDAAGAGISGVSVRVENPSVSPAIDVVDITNNDGVLQLVGVPTSTQSYSIQVGKTGYSSDQTYPIGGVGNPNPLKPHATVAAQTVTNISFAIDRVSQLTVRTSDKICSPYPSADFSLAGAKIVGTSPDVLKFSTNDTTGADGVKIFPNVEWDTYTLALNEAGYDIAGTMPFSPLTINPNSTLDFRFVLRPADPASLLVTVKDALTKQGIAGATVTLSKPGFAVTATTSIGALYFTNWSGGGYASQSGALDMESDPGSVTLLANASGTYPTASAEWFTSDTIDLGGSSSTLHDFSFEGSMPPGAGSDSIKFQLASNDDNATWNFTGPGGSPATYYTSTSFVPDSILNGKRYLRYKAFLSTSDGAVTPRLDAALLEFNADCVPPYQVLIGGLAADTYTINISAPGHADYSGSFLIDSDQEQTEILL